MTSPPAAYPREREAEVVLRDGTTVHVRPVRPDDRPAIRTFLGALSTESISFRFFGSANLDWAAKWSTDVDYLDRFGLVVESGTPRQVLAHAAYVRIDAERAEVAFLVADAWQGRGISTILLAHLAEAAGEHGITTFVAEVLPHNHRMIDVFRESGFPVRLHSVPDALEIELPTSLTPAALARFEERERIAAVAAVKSFLEPRAVAVVGASRHRGTIGGEILHNLLESGIPRSGVPGQRQGEGRAIGDRLPVGARDTGPRRPGRYRRARGDRRLRGPGLRGGRRAGAPGRLLGLRRDGTRGARTGSAGWSTCVATLGSGSSGRIAWVSSTRLPKCD